MIPEMIRISILLAIAVIYALFDVFNKRDVPNIFVYATIVIGAAVALTYDIRTIEFGALIAVGIGWFGYLMYKAGFLGAGDVFEFIFVSLVFPMQPVPLLSGLGQMQLPFIFSVLIAAGYAATLFIPVYYLLLGERKRVSADYGFNKHRVVKAAALLVAYLIMLAVLYEFASLSAVAVALVLLIAIPSSIMLLYEKEIYLGMVSFIYPRSMTDGDMIAVNLMRQGDIAFFKKKDPEFGRLATNSIIKRIKNAKRKIPVYRNSVPFALFMLIGIVISILFGNLVLYIVA
ncbi:MAG: hypothetical protein KGI00_05105 [Candidatus Micrarchaeota archaeon]|nr:hypothetical protein [Candidatus Micrarchaeota archaeon]MDE1824579.1 hypothetical protein [Candidatus Micrarchaeota archaeon]MDE1850077.1 hypothetical protein [Candidatus Micrarchaeota archaeon]